MEQRAIFIAAAFIALAATGCCKACSTFSKEFSGPDAAKGEQLVQDRLAHDEKLRKQICGVDTKELTNLVIKKTPAGQYSIQGTPVEHPMEKPPAAKPDAGAPSKSLIDPKKALVCTAVMSVFWDVKEDSGKTTWSIESISVAEVTTPGAEYKRPSADWD